MNYLNDVVTQSENKELHYSSSTEEATEFFIAMSLQGDGFSNMTQFVFRSHTVCFKQHSPNKELNK
jgi:hypothetical protein